MSETKLIRDHHLLTRNLKLNGKYISNDGGDEGISIQDDGDVIINGTGKLYLNDAGGEYISGTQSALSINSGGAITLEGSLMTLDSSDNIILDTDVGVVQFRNDGTTHGSIAMDVANKFSWTSTTNYMLRIIAPGTGGVDIDSDDNIILDATSTTAGEGILFKNAGTLIGDVTLHHNATNFRLIEDGGTNGGTDYFNIAVEEDGHAKITTHDHSGAGNGDLEFEPAGKLLFTTGHGETHTFDYDNTLSANNSGLLIDYNSDGDLDSGLQTLNNTAFRIDMDRVATTSDGSSFTNNIGCHIDVTSGDSDGTMTNTGVKINAQGGDANYALVTSGGHVGIGVTDPDQALEVNGAVHIEDTAYFTTPGTVTGDGTTTVDWRTGNKYHLTFAASTNEEITFGTNPAGACNLILKLKQPASGAGCTVDWEVTLGTIYWAGGGTEDSGSEPTLSTGADDVDIISFYFDGTNYYGVASLGFDA